RHAGPGARARREAGLDPRRCEKARQDLLDAGVEPGTGQAVEGGGRAAARLSQRRGDAAHRLQPGDGANPRRLVHLPGGAPLTLATPARVTSAKAQVMWPGTSGAATTFVTRLP